MADTPPMDAETKVMVPVTQKDRDAVQAFHRIQVDRIMRGDRTLGDDKGGREQGWCECAAPSAGVRDAGSDPFDVVGWAKAMAAKGGPHEWGYRDPVTGEFIADPWPFHAVEYIAALTARPDGETTDQINPMVDPEVNWLVHQLEAWPTRVDPDRTTNISLLMQKAAWLIRGKPIAYTPSPTANAGGEREIAAKAMYEAADAFDVEAGHDALPKWEQADDTVRTGVFSVIDAVFAALATKGGAE